MKIGDKVRFLNESGGGRITGFQSKNIALVEDADGFEIPFSVNELVVIEDNNVNAKQPVVSFPKQVEQSEPVTIQERKGGDKLSLFLAYVPVNIKELSSTNIETYIVNDCNYYVRYALYIGENNSWSLKTTGEIEPNTQLFIEEFGRDTLNDYSRVCIQALAYKKDKPFGLLAPCELIFRIDPMKFYKLHSFDENDFFDSPAMLYEVSSKAENIVLSKEKAVDVAKQMQANSHQNKDNSYVRRYDDRRKRSNPFLNTRQNDDVLVVDLHAHELLETTAGMSNSDILNYQLDVFRKTLDENKKNKNARIVFIHGKGEGVLRQAIIHELKYRFKSYPYQDASFQEYGYGATQVTIK